MKPNDMSGHQVSIAELAKFLRGAMSLVVTLVVAGSGITGWYQSRIERRLDRAITYDEFIRWEEELRQSNPGTKLKSMSLFHSGAAGRPANSPRGPTVANY